MSSDETATIIAAAIKTEDGRVFSVPKPGRHNHVIKLMVDSGEKKPISGEQGFVLTDGRFVDRLEAYRIAKDNNQLLSRAYHGPKLFSEDVW